MPHFTPGLFEFLDELAHNNDREWFGANKQRYVDEVQEPALSFINDFAPVLEQISPHFQADSRVVGGSLFRIQRDTRFSKDKTPYKTNTGLQFRHESGRDVHAPGFYLHLQPGECFAGVGLWHPEAKVAQRIREHIDEHRSEWMNAVGGEAIREEWSRMGDRLVRPPRGFDPLHPLIEDLKAKDFVLSVRLSEQEVLADDFLDRYAELCGQVAPFMRFLCEGLDLPF